MNLAPVTRLFGRIVLKARAKSPELLLIAGGISFVGTVILASKETLKFQEVLEEHNKALEQLKKTEEQMASGEIQITAFSKADARRDRMIIYKHTILDGVKTYGKAIGLGIVSFSCFAGAVGIVRGWLVGAVALNTQLRQENHALEEAVISEYGAEKLNELKAKGCGSTVIHEEDPETGELKVKETYGTTPEAFSIFFDSASRAFVKNDHQANTIVLETKLQYANHRLRTRGYLFINELLDMLDYPEECWLQAGNLYGWKYYKDPKEAKKHGAANCVSFGLDGPNAALDPVNARFLAGLEDVALLRFNCDPEPILGQLGWRKK